MRQRSLIEIEISAARWAFLAADETGDWTEADKQYERLDELLDEFLTIPRQRHPQD